MTSQSTGVSYAAKRFFIKNGDVADTKDRASRFKNGKKENGVKSPELMGENAIKSAQMMYLNGSPEQTKFASLQTTLLCRAIKRCDSMEVERILGENGDLVLKWLRLDASGPHKKKMALLARDRCAPVPEFAQLVIELFASTENMQSILFIAKSEDDYISACAQQTLQSMG